jgi:hypothetical protein
MATANPDGLLSGAIILGPTGYWYTTRYNDSKPMTWSLKAKADWNRHWSKVSSHFLTGIQYTGSKN